MLIMMDCPPLWFTITSCWIELDDEYWHRSIQSPWHCGLKFWNEPERPFRILLHLPIYHYPSHPPTKIQPQTNPPWWEWCRNTSAEPVQFFISWATVPFWYSVGSWRTEVPNYKHTYTFVFCITPQIIIFSANRNKKIPSIGNSRFSLRVQLWVCLY